MRLMGHPARCEYAKSEKSEVLRSAIIKTEKFRKI